MTLTSPNSSATTLNRRAFVVLSLAAYASAQYYDPYYDNNGNTPGRVIAGIVVAICIAILFLICFALMFRRRRRGLTCSPELCWGKLPRVEHPRPHAEPEPGAVRRIPHVQPAGVGRLSGAPWPPPQGENPPPPPYPGKPQPYDGEVNSGYGYPTSPHQEAPKPGGFVAPQTQTPSSPAPAHVNANSPWFRSS
ncbi:hypothetical protein C8T65DRAFT_639876 [Cerioporus squamosus]|nr:hypothetical protein C8T65DRAFT_639876 [Cerioporus squamosus]